MAEYKLMRYEDVKAFCEKCFEGYGFSAQEAAQITDILLTADLYGVESHGIQRLIRYHKEITGGLVDVHAKPEIVFETPLSAVIDGHDAMGQLLGKQAMDLAIEKAKKSGVGMVSVRNSNHYGVAGYYARMAMEQGLTGICMCNTEAIMVPTFGKRAMLGTNPIAFAMPAEPVPFAFDSATTVVPRGKLEVYSKRGNGIPDGWAVDENGHSSTDSDRVLKNIIGRVGGGILPLGGVGELNSGHKGYGFALIVEIMTGILSGGVTSNYVYQREHGSGIAQFFMAYDHGMFGNKAEIEAALTKYLEELRESDKALGQERIYIHGDKAAENKARIMANGIPLNEKTYAEMKMIGEYTGASDLLPAEY